MMLNKIGADALANKSTLAKLLASESITVQHNPSARTASFNLETRVLTLPVFKDGMSPELVDMLIIHEVGHAINTPKEGWVNAIDSISEKHDAKRDNIRGFLNVVEDPRNDKLMKRKFPGSRRDYVFGYKELHAVDFFKIARRDINDMGFVDRANLYFKGGGMMDIEFDETEQHYINKIAATESFQDVAELTEEIFLFCRSRKQEENDFGDDDLSYGFDPDGEPGEVSEVAGEGDEGEQEMSGRADDSDDSDEADDEAEGNTDGKGDDDSDDEADGDADGDAAGDSDDEADGDADGKGDGEDEDDTDDSDESESSPDQGHGGEDSQNWDSDDDPESETDQAWEQSLDSLISVSNIPFNYVTIPDFKLEHMIDDYKVVVAEKTRDYEKSKKKILSAAARYDEYQRRRILSIYENLSSSLKQFMAKEKSVVSYMVKEFEMKKAAQAYARESVSKTGVIDTNKLHSYRYNEDIFKRNLTVPRGKNHGFVMFLDWSGSMSMNLRRTVQQLINLTMFCRQVAVPFEVYTFRSAGDKRDGRYYESLERGRTQEGRETTVRICQMSGKESDIMFDSVKFRNILSSRMTVAEYNLSLNHLWFQSASGYGFELDCDPLTSTPLDQTILAASGVIDIFKKRSGVEITNVVFLTDGDSDGNPGTYGDNRYGRSTFGSSPERHFMLQDNQTKKSYDLGRSRWAMVGDTDLFLRVLKDRTEINLLGFFISSGKFKNVIYRSGLTNNIQDYVERMDAEKKLKESWNKDKYMSGAAKGYDEYYILDSEGMKLGAEEMNITPDMTKSQQIKEFKRVGRSVKGKRQMLKSFIGHVCD